MITLSVFQEKEKSKLLSENYAKAIEFETSKVSEFSLDVVKNSEKIIRVIYSPVHVDVNTGKLKATVFDDVFTHGLSVERVKYKSIKSIFKDAEVIATIKQRKIHDMQKANVGKIRKIIDNGYRLFAVYDTATRENIAHAEVCIIGRKALPNVDKNIFRRKIQKEFSSHKNIIFNLEKINVPYWLTKYKNFHIFIVRFLQTWKAKIF